MKTWRVDRRINNVKINEPSLAQPVKEDFPDPEKPQRLEKPKRQSRTDESGQLGMLNDPSL
jgi:hypothetical protein